MDVATRVALGRYRHFKGGVYVVVGVARHVDLPEEFVVYRADGGEQCLFVRPMQAFLEDVEVNGERQPRFEYLGPEVDSSLHVHELADG